MVAFEYGKPLDHYVPRCEYCGDHTFALCPIPMSRFVVENWRDRMGSVLSDLVVYCHKCGRAVPIKNLKFERM